jgi:alpha-1,3-rhamnosyltransferase
MIATELQEETEQILGDGPATVSVVVPSYNHARFVETTLRSIIRQTLWPAQLLVIDDGSSDNSPAVIERVLNDCPFPCELVARENRGLCATLNEGFARTRGDYFAYLGSDDLWLPEFLDARVDQLAARPAAVLAYGHAYLIDAEDAIVDATADWAHYADGNVREMLLATTAPMSPTVLYRRSALGPQPWDETSLLEDYDLYLRLSAAGEFAFNPRILSAWRRHDTNVSGDQRLMLRAQLEAQRAAALRFGFTQSQIERLQRVTTFRRAEDFLRVGQKSAALNLIWRNWRGADSLRVTARLLLRLLLPQAVWRRRGQTRRRRAQERYGSL